MDKLCTSALNRRYYSKRDRLKGVNVKNLADMQSESKTDITITQTPTIFQ